MTEVQENMFEEDKLRQRKENLEADVRLKAAALKDTLKASEAYMKLLTSGPRLVTEIYFRCQQRDLAHDQLRLLENQAYELGRQCGASATALEQIRTAEDEIAEICGKLGIERDDESAPEPSGVESEELGFDTEDNVTPEPLDEEHPI